MEQMLLHFAFISWNESPCTILHMSLLLYVFSLIFNEMVILNDLVLLEV